MFLPVLINSCSPTHLARNYHIHIQNQNSKLIYPLYIYLHHQFKIHNSQLKTMMNIKNSKFPQNSMIVHAQTFIFFSLHPWLLVFRTMGIRIKKSNPTKYIDPSTKIKLSKYPKSKTQIQY
ncbi:transmembrane protein, putative [Medicago truncatula]|uniref:Transmembrane protein, putative n=1 Tax=Medicago truncatula TaxID=3880 RepID=A0A072U3F1_MEDTR|nr:transmembrane protein, putative [Medicago truncatula]